MPFQKGEKSTLEEIEKARQGRLQYYQHNDVWNKGIPHSEEARQKISESCKRSRVGTWNKKTEDKSSKRTKEWKRS